MAASPPAAPAPGLGARGLGGGGLGGGGLAVTAPVPFAGRRERRAPVRAGDGLRGGVAGAELIRRRPQRANPRRRDGGPRVVLLPGEGRSVFIQEAGAGRILQRVPFRRGTLPRDHVVGKPHQGGQAAFEGRPEADMDPVPGGQAGDDEQAHPPGHRDVHDGGVVQPPIGVGHLLRAHPDALVGDVQQDAAAVQRVPRHVHEGLRGGERGGVLGELGQQVDDVVDRLRGPRCQAGCRG